MLKQRIITAIFALPIFLGFMHFAPDWLMIPFFMLLVALGTYEMATILVPKMESVFKPSKGDVKAPLWLVPTAVGFACLIFLGSSIYSSDGGRGMVLAGILGGILVGCFCAPDNDTAFARMVALLVSIVYGSFPWLATWDLFLMGDGARYAVFLCAVVWAGDTGAYFGGKRFGKNKLAPRMSPKKTWEGSIAGLIASVLGGVLCNVFYQGSLGSWPIIAFASLLGGAFGQMGDLVESTLKRFAGVKDSGVIFPGHGGFLDRVDGLLFAAPIIWFILYNAAP